MRQALHEQRRLSAGGGHQWWRAHHEVFDTRVMLQVVPFDGLLDPAEAATVVTGLADGMIGRGDLSVDGRSLLAVRANPLRDAFLITGFR